MGALQADVPMLMYWREMLWQQPWRLLTGHWVHINVIHWLLNSMALLLLPYVLPAPSRLVFVVLLVTLSFLLSCSLFILNPVLQEYVGLSGVLHGLYAALAVSAWHDRRERPFAGIVLLALILKLISEWAFGSAATAQLIGGKVVLSAHREGAFFGILLGLVFLKRMGVNKRS